MKGRPSHDPVRHPSHYMGCNGIEVIDVIEGFELNYHRGNVVKYVCRAGRKTDELEDLKKALCYLAREIERIEHGQEQDKGIG